MGTNITFEIDKVFDVNFDFGEFITVFMVEQSIESAIKTGKKPHFTSQATPTGIILKGVGFNANIPIDKANAEGELLDLIKAVENGQKVTGIPQVGELNPDRTTLKVNFTIYKEGDIVHIRPTCNYNPFKDKSIIPVKKKTIKEEYISNLAIKKMIDYIRSRKALKEDVVFVLKRKGIEPILHDIATDIKTPFDISNEQVYDYMVDGYKIYARVKEIDDSPTNMGLITIKFEMLITI